MPGAHTLRALVLPHSGALDHQNELKRFIENLLLKGFGLFNGPPFGKLPDYPHSELPFVKPNTRIT